MKGHIKKSEIIMYFSELLSDHDMSRIREHVIACPECRSKFNLFKKIQSPAISEHIKPGDNPFTGRNTSGKRPAAGKFHFNLKTVSAISVAAAVILAVTVAFYIDYEADMLVLASHVGSVEMRNKSPRKFVHGDMISTHHKSSARLSFGKGYTITLGPNTELGIDKAEYSSNKSNIEFNLIRGSIVSKHMSGNVSYLIKAGNTIIKPVGTEFFIELDNDTALVMVKKGSCSIDADSSHQIVNQNEGFTIADNIISPVAYREDYINDIMREINPELSPSGESSNFTGEPGAIYDEVQSSYDIEKSRSTVPQQKNK